MVVKYPYEKFLLTAYYEKRISVLKEDRIIFFDPTTRLDCVGAEKLSYNEYLDIQFTSLGKTYRSYFETVFLNAILSYFKGQIEKVTPKYICFKRIYIKGMYSDGTVFDGKEDHVWMDKSDFDGFGVGDSVSFDADVYRYVKTGNGKLIDYGLRNPTNIQKIELYELSTDDELLTQEIEQIICETCLLSEQCNHTYCIMN